MQDRSKEKVEQSHILPWGRRLDTTLAVPVPSLEGGDMDGNTAGPEEGQYEQILEKDLHQGDQKEEDLGQHPEDKADREVEHEQ